MQLKIVPELDEHQNADLGAASNNTFGHASNGPFIYFNFNGTSWEFNKLEGGCTAAIPDQVNITNQGNNNIDFEILLRDNSGQYNEQDYVVIKMSLEWD